MEKYRLIQEIGSGSYSIVYQAENIYTKQLVAIKIMKFTYSQGKKSQDMELQSLKIFNKNPCIIKLKEYFIKSDIIHFVFQLLSMNLIDYYKLIRAQQNRNLEQKQIKMIIFQTVIALSDMHAQGFAHRDIKPENIMLNIRKNQHGWKVIESKLVDFGLTKKLQKQKNTQYVATRWYRAPQLILDLNYKQSVDIFALGCVALQLYLGFEAFPGQNAVDQLNKTFYALGTPSNQEWPELYKYMKNKNISLPVYRKQSLIKIVPNLNNYAADLIQRMLICNPANRITCKQILKHPYFGSIKSQLSEVILNYIRAQQTPLIRQSPQILRTNYLTKQLFRGNTGSTTSSLLQTNYRQEIHSPQNIKKSYHKLNVHASQKQLNKQLFKSVNMQSLKVSPNKISLINSTTRKKKINLTIMENFIHPLTERKKKFLEEKKTELKDLSNQSFLDHCNNLY